MDTNNKSSRRNFIKTSAKATLAAGLAASTLSSFANDNDTSFFINDDKTPFTQTPLPYDYKALEPNIDAQTMKIHYTKHAAAYTKNLAEACAAENVNTQSTSLESLVSSVSKYSPKMLNNAGGHYNHELFWKIMSPNQSILSGNLNDMIVKDFGSADAFKTQFNDAAKNRFGSGWAWLIYTPEKKLVVASTPNQDNPLMDVSEVKGFPVLGLDVWEHAYYLKYQNKRPDYVAAWWNVVNWNFVQQRFQSNI